MLSKRSWLIAFLSAAVIGGAQTAVAETKDSLALASAWEITSVDPAISGFALQRLQIQENLVDADSEGTLRPGLATEWSPSDDGLTWRFTLRENVSFHDGTPFDATSAVSALQRAAEQPGILENAPLGEISTDGDAVVITLEKPFRPPTAEWGIMMTELLPYWREAPWLILQPVACLVVTVLSLHLAVGIGKRP